MPYFKCNLNTWIRICFPNVDPDPATQIRLYPLQQCCGMRIHDILVWIRIRIQKAQKHTDQDQDPDPQHFLAVSFNYMSFSQSPGRCRGRHSDLLFRSSPGKDT
jgi:hypothetical protein